MQPLLLLFNSQLGDEVQKDCVEKNHCEYEHVAIILSFVNRNHEAIPLKKECNSEEKKENVNVVLEGHPPALENEISLLLVFPNIDHFDLVLYDISIFVIEQEWIL